jgi:nucleoside-diphosphate-sugar epimerase
VSREEIILVTGSGGFIGGWLAETLHLRGLAHVRAGIHSWVGAARIARFPMEVVVCDILEKEQVHDAMDGVSRVIHCAKGPSRESIVEGTRNMLAVALENGVKGFVYVSTAEVYGNAMGEIDERTNCEKRGDPYSDAKIEAETLCWEYLARGLPVTVVRPSIVYGPFSTTWTVDIARKLGSGNWGMFAGHGDGICNLIYIADLVSAILRAARGKRAVGEAFNLNGPEMVTWNEYFQRFNTALGLPDMRVVTPGDARLRASLVEPVRASAKFIRDHFEDPIKKVAASYRPARRMMKHVEVVLKTSVRPGDLSLFSRRAVYTAAKAREMLGFTPAVDLEAGLQMTVSWLEQVGLLGGLAVG